MSDSKKSEPKNDAEEQVPQQTGFSSDYREAYKEAEPKKKAKRSKLNSTVRSTVHTVKSAAKKNIGMIPNLDTDSSEPEPELDDFLPEDTKNEDEELLTKEAEPLQLISVDDTAAPRHRHKRKYGIAVGALVMVFALVGVCFLVGTIGGKIYSVATDDSKLRAYDTYLSAIVMQDPEPFASTAVANEGMVLQASLWRAVTQNGSQYTNYDDAGRSLVPLADVVDACHELFGSKCELQPESQKNESFFEYDSKKNMFHVLPYSSQSSFSAYTVSSYKSGDSTVLKVGYVSATDDWRNAAASQAVKKPTPTKYMEYVLKTDSTTKKEYVSAVRAVKAEK
jgi:hypothetical protein